MHPFFQVVGLWLTASALVAFLQGLLVSKYQWRHGYFDDPGPCLAAIFPMFGAPVYFCVLCFKLGQAARENICKDGGCD